MSLNIEPFYDAHLPYFERGRDDLRELLERLISEWDEDYGFRVEHSPILRVKSLARLTEKVLRLGSKVASAEQLLTSPHPVRDIIGARVVVRSLTDVASLRRALHENFGVQQIALDDKNEKPSSTGYRALHVDGLIPAKVKNKTVEVPFELQVKTLAQNTWGQFTHDGAYVMTDINGDARFQTVRSLQRILAEQLEIADSLQQEIERISEVIVTEIADADPGDAVTPANVLNSVFARMNLRLPLAAAIRISASLGAVGIVDIATASDLLVGEGELAELASVSFKQDYGRTPHLPELFEYMTEHLVALRAKIVLGAPSETVG